MKRVKISLVEAGLTHTRQLVANQPVVVLKDLIEANLPLSAFNVNEEEGTASIVFDLTDDLKHYLNFIRQDRTKLKDYQKNLHHVKIHGTAEEVEETKEVEPIVDIQDWQDEYLTITGEQKPKRRTKAKKTIE